VFFLSSLFVIPITSWIPTRTAFLTTPKFHQWMPNEVSKM
jgi:hypothetical protein